MSFQVLVKTTPAMNGAYTYLLGSREEAEEFVRREDVFWYHFPSEHDDWDWRRGGAWKPAHEVTREELLADPPPTGPGTRGLHPQQVIYDEAVKFYEKENGGGDDDGENDDRW